jgi:homogentisate phytyltransferase/homogentisate geranylgeranyltransferase
MRFIALSVLLGVVLVCVNSWRADGFHVLTPSRNSILAPRSRIHLSSRSVGSPGSSRMGSLSLRPSLSSRGSSSKLSASPMDTLVGIPPATLVHPAAVTGPTTVPGFLRTVWEFSRPHTIIGTLLSITTLYLYAVPPSARISAEFIVSLIEAIVPSVLMNLYVTGLNQLTDVAIDKVNKPYLPLASGVLSMPMGVALVVGSLLGSLYLARDAAWPLQLALTSTAFLGTVYSLPPFRLKRFPALAAVCILAVRGTIVNILYFLQAKTDVLNYDLPNLSESVARFPEIVPVTLFFAVFGCVIALMKDVPDIAGDTAHNIRSFSVRYGPAAMFK